MEGSKARAEAPGKKPLREVESQLNLSGKACALAEYWRTQAQHWNNLAEEWQDVVLFCQEQQRKIEELRHSRDLNEAKSSFGS